jgi:hypothetical protein
MTRCGAAALLIAAVVCVPAVHGRAAAQAGSGLAGRWTLNPSLSQIPRDVGFGMDIATAAGAASKTDDRTGGGGAPSGMLLFRESADDATRRDQLVAEVQTPSPHLTVVQTDAAVTITSEPGQLRTFHPDGRSEYQALGQVSVVTTSKWDGPRLDVRYRVEQNRELRYTFSRIANPPQLVIEVRLVERGGHQVVTLVYEPAKPNETVAAERLAPTAAPAAPVAPPPAIRPPGPDALAPAPALTSPAMRAVGAIRPDEELRGLAALGVVVEGLSPQAAACGLSQAPLEALVSKSLGDAGFKTMGNSDEDSYVYVQVMTTATPAGLCISSYDVYLYTHTMATLPYQSSPVLVRVELLRKGGITGGSPKTHGDVVGKSVKQLVDEIASRIRAAGALAIRSVEIGPSSSSEGP